MTTKADSNFVITAIDNFPGEQIAYSMFKSSNPVFFKKVLSAWQKGLDLNITSTVHKTA